MNIREPHAGPDAAGSATTESGTDAHSALVHGDEACVLTADDLQRDVFGLRDRVPAGAVAAVTSDCAAVVLAALTALDGWAERIDLLGPDIVPGAGAVVLDDTVATTTFGSRTVAVPGDRKTRCRVWSSGTTGTPTPTDHSVSALTGQGRGASGRRLRWGLVLSPTRMAGIQILLQAYHGEEVVDATHLSQIDDQVAYFADQGVDAISATPTLWRRILQSPSSARLRLRQVTLGGEIASQPLLDTLVATFGARVTHVYASTEAGTVFSVSDGSEGFPVNLLSRHRDDASAPGLEIRDGVLYVQSDDSSATDPTGFVRTDDLVEVQADRVLFVGRASGVVNVGGDKVAPERLEALLRTHPAVAEAAAWGRPNSFTGNVLAARITLMPGTERTAGLDRELRTWVRGQLPRPYVPARIDVVDHLTTTRSGKVSRI